MTFQYGLISPHMSFSSHELLSLPKTNMKSKDSGNITQGFEIRKLYSHRSLYS